MTYSSSIDSFQAIADPNRRHILTLLSKGEKSINDISEHFDISRPAISKHIKVLYHTGFITIEEVGRERICYLNQAGFDEIKTWMDFFEQYWNNQVQKLENLLNKHKNQKK
ncbi:ArsR/SmtB family transcription factor [Olivibacter sitiensis]|uniref:ArsR/SmtB family transcription factor n=1 Tax=Olivibacter sitiensis TaxID=376470 RepID=UPI00041AC88D|nr:metalloregulator ArsR/SmtB family transcription factor [Olivibacter sitiensis]